MRRSEGQRPVLTRPIRRSGSSVSRPRTTPAYAPKQNSLADPDCISLRDQLFDDENFTGVEDNRLVALLGHLREHIHQRALFEDYDEAKRARDLSLSIHDELQRRATYRPDMTPQEQLISDRRKNFESDWSERRRLYDAETAKQVSALENKQAHDQRVFERVWNEDRPHRYRKPSGHLLQMRQIEKSMALMGHIDAASDVHEYAISVAAREQEMAQRQLDTDYEQSYARLLEDQRRAMDLLLDKRKHGRLLLDREYRKEEGYLEAQEGAMRYRVQRDGHERVRELRTQPAMLSKSHGTALGTLLPPLRPPNDPQYRKNKDQKRTERARAQSRFQRENAEKVLAAYEYVPPQPEEPKQPRKRRPVERQPDETASQTEQPPEDDETGSQHRPKEASASEQPAEQGDQPTDETTAKSEEQTEEVAPESEQPVAAERAIASEGRMEAEGEQPPAPSQEQREGESEQQAAPSEGQVEGGSEEVPAGDQIAVNVEQPGDEGPIYPTEPDAVMHQAEDVEEDSQVPDLIGDAPQALGESMAEPDRAEERTMGDGGNAVQEMLGDLVGQPASSEQEEAATEGNEAEACQDRDLQAADGEPTRAVDSMVPDALDVVPAIGQEMPEAGEGNQRAEGEADTGLVDMLAPPAATIADAVLSPQDDDAQQAAFGPEAPPSAEVAQESTETELEQTEAALQQAEPEPEQTEAAPEPELAEAEHDQAEADEQLRMTFAEVGTGVGIMVDRIDSQKPADGHDKPPAEVDAALDTAAVPEDRAVEEKRPEEDALATGEEQQAAEGQGADDGSSSHVLTDAVDQPVLD